MATYKIYKDGEEINRIVADEAFVVPYCEENGYTYELDVPPEPIGPPEPAPTEQETTDAMLVDHELRITMLEMGL